MNDSFTAGWKNMLKHTHTYTDPVTHTPCIHMLSQCLMFCQGFRLYPPEAKNKCMKDVEARSPLKTSFHAQMMKKQRDKVLIQGTRNSVLRVHSYQSQMKIVLNIFIGLSEGQ